MALHKIGAAWTNKDKNDDTYISAILEWPGMELTVKMFKNKNRENEKQPYFNVFFDDGKDSGGKTKKSDNGFDDDIPFD